MNLVNLEDVCSMTRYFSREEFAGVLKIAMVGQFNDRSWYFRHYRLFYLESDKEHSNPK